MQVTDSNIPSKPLILITGVSGYVGGRLRNLLEKKGYPLRCLVRAESAIPDKIPSQTRYVIGDASNQKALIEAMDGVEVAFYLIHSMGSKLDFSDMDRRIAVQFAQTASHCGVKRIIYLGGLGSNYDELSPHLKSRHEVGEILRSNAEGVQVIELRASIVLGSGSLSFEMIRALVEKLPIMITPRWVRMQTQPIGIEDLLQYLVKSIDIDVEGNPVFEIGGKDRVTYQDLMLEYARERGLKRWIIPVPVLTPRLSSLWLGLVTPLYARVGKKLVESASCPTIVRDPLATHLFNIPPMSVKEAIDHALANENRPYPETRWNDALSSSLSRSDEPQNNYGCRIVDTHEAIVKALPAITFRAISQIGGSRGYYGTDGLFWLRGVLDLIVGGVGLRRGRRDPENLHRGDVVDFWRVEEMIPNTYLKLSAEMKLPGRAWLEFRVVPHEKGSKIIQNAIFDPLGTAGVLYWYLLLPFHQFVFSRMLKGIARRAEKGEV